MTWILTTSGSRMNRITSDIAESANQNPLTMRSSFEPPRVLLIGPDPAAVSGISTHLAQLLQSRLGIHFRLSYFAIGSAGKREHLLARFMRLLASPVDLWRTIRKIRPQISHINTSLLHTSFWRDVLYIVVSKVCGVNVVLQIHGGSFSTFCDRGRLLRRLLSRILNYADVVVVLSKREQIGCAPFRVRALVTIPNAVNLEEYENLPPKQYRGLSAFRLAYIGRLADDKGIYETIEAMAILDREGITNITFTVAGEGEEEGRLREWAVKLGMTDRVYFVGSVFGNKKIDFWREADLFLLPTYCPEGLPYALLESLASGTPVVTTRAGAIAEAIDAGAEGVFVEPRSASAVSGALQQLMQDPLGLEQMSVACRLRSRMCYGIDRLVAQFSQTYSEVMQQTKTSATHMIEESRGNQADTNSPPDCKRLARTTSRH